MVTLGDPAMKARIDSERNQGRAPDMDWLDHDRLGFNYRLTDLACAIGLAQLDRLDGMLADARAGRRLVPRGAGRPRARARPRPALRGRGSRRRRGWFVFVVQVPRESASATTSSARLRERGVQSQALPAGDPPDVLLPRDATGTARASSRSARTSRRGRSRCRSSRPCARPGRAGRARSAACSRTDVPWQAGHSVARTGTAPGEPGRRRWVRGRRWRCRWSSAPVIADIAQAGTPTASACWSPAGRRGADGARARCFRPDRRGRPADRERSLPPPAGAVPGPAGA